MKNLLIVAALAAAGYFGWKMYKDKQPPEPAPLNDPNKTPGANAANRVDNLSGAAPGM